mmetsp:Transcript_22610/g.62767  ORF Transcript_22610/g.62767 Transcript_22610/m.62767 type:complete len:590 (-) Transcript_22610:668-2437(-)
MLPSSPRIREVMGDSLRHLLPPILSKKVGYLPTLAEPPNSAFLFSAISFFVAICMREMQLVWPVLMDTMRGVTSLQAQLTLAPPASSTSTTLACPFLAASHRAVAPGCCAPSLHRTSTSSSSEASRARTHSTSPRRVASCSGDRPSSLHWLGSTDPLSTMYFTWVWSPERTAVWSTLAPSALVASICTPASSSAASTSSHMSSDPAADVECPFDMRRCTGVLPSMAIALAFAPPRSSIRTTPRWRLAAAIWSAVRWSIVRESIFAPASRSTLTHSTWPCSAATHSGVAPSMARDSKLARKHRAVTTLSWPLEAAIQRGEVLSHISSGAAPLSRSIDTSLSWPLQAAIHMGVAPPLVTTLPPPPPLPLPLKGEGEEAVLTPASTPMRLLPSSSLHFPLPSGFLSFPRCSRDSITALTASPHVSSISTTDLILTGSFLKAPALSRASAHRKSPFEQAIHSGMVPVFAWGTLGSALNSNKMSRISLWPAATVENNTVWPPFFLNSTFAPFSHNARTILALLSEAEMSIGVAPSMSSVSVLPPMSMRNCTASGRSHRAAMCMGEMLPCIISLDTTDMAATSWCTSSQIFRSNR